MIANLITVSRILLSLFLLFLSPYSVLFMVIYLLCGVTDVLDGFLARKFHTESQDGERPDSIADIVFAVVYAVKILPILHLPLWIWCWIVLIAVVKIVGIIIANKKERSFYIAHSVANKLTGLLIFTLPLTVRLFDVKYGAAVVCAAATFAAIQEGHLIRTGRVIGKDE